MKTHKLQPFMDLVKQSASKGDIFSDCGLTVDYSLPQNWLDSFANFWYESTGKDIYHTVLTTTCWAYGDGYQGPITCCQEVSDAWQIWRVYQ